MTKAYPGHEVPAVADLNLHVRRGELIAILGPSGCGKTTSLRMIAGLETPTSGSIRIDGRDITRLPVHRRGIGVVFQSCALFPNRNVRRNIGFGLETRGVNRADRTRQVDEALKMVELAGLGNRRIRDLSGGQQQRVALARALVIDPSILLLDEPLSNLDAKLRLVMRQEIRRVHDHSGITTVFVTHDQSEALDIADRVLVMNNGAVEQFDMPQVVYDRPQATFVANFVGEINALTGTVLETGSRAIVRVDGLAAIAGRAPVAVTKGSVATVAVRPHRCRVVPRSEEGAASATNPVLRGKVCQIRYSGRLVTYLVDLGPCVWRVEQLSNGTAPHAVGDAVGATWAEDDASVLRDRFPADDSADAHAGETNDRTDG